MTDAETVERSRQYWIVKKVQGLFGSLVALLVACGEAR